MIIPTKTKNEENRLKALDSFDILDTLPEKDYDSITAIAAEICQTNIALISLVDSNRQWFKSHHGLEAEETPHDYSFCAHAINPLGDIFIIEDARLDERFFDNPLVTGDPYVIFYAGVPLITSEGQALGTLCVIDDQPKQLNEKQIFSLKALANQVVHCLELRRNKVLLEQSNRELVLKNKELQELTYIASHDLQEPIRTIKNFASHLDKKYSNELEATGKKSLSFILEASERMGRLLKELLNYSLIGHQSAMTEVDANAVVQSILDDFHLAIEETQAKVTFAHLPTLAVFETEFRLLLQNLICNAIKFSRPNCAPVIVVSAVESPTEWTFQIADNGIGIAPKYQEKIFEIFQRLHLKEDYRGTGIGLSHCKKIVELHRGQIWVESQEQEGSTFYFTLPKKQLCRN